MTDDWSLPPWEHDGNNRAQRVWDPDSGGWIVMTRDGNGAFSAAWKPDIAKWVAAIGQAVVAARLKADGPAVGPR
jgi:hypothetical protein